MSLVQGSNTISGKSIGSSPVPTQEGKAGKFLHTNGAITDWKSIKEIVIYDEETSYDEGALVFSMDVEGFLCAYKSLTDDNVGNPLDDTDNWKQIYTRNQANIPLLSYFYSDHKYNDISYLMADNFSWQSGNTYKEVYNHLVEDKESVVIPTGTITKRVPNCFYSRYLNIDDGVFSNFTAQDSIFTPMAFDPQDKTWEIKTRFKTNPSFGVRQIIFHLVQGNQDYNIFCYIKTNAYIAWGMSSNGTSWNLLGETQIGTPLVANTFYYVKMGFTGTEYYYEISEDGVEYTRIGTLASTALVFTNRGLRFGSYTDGSPIGGIDLNNTSITIDDEVVWTGYTDIEVPVENPHLKGGEWNYNNVTKYGFVNNDKQILSNFLTTVNFANHYAKKPTSSFEYVLKVKQDTLTANTSFVEASANVKGMILRNMNASTGQVSAWFGTGSAWTLSSYNTQIFLKHREWTYVKVIWENNIAYFYQSNDGIIWSLKSNIPCALPIDWDTNHTQGLGGASWENYAFPNGFIDLKECYLKVDGETIWKGCENYPTFTCYEASDDHKIVLADDADIIEQRYNVFDDGYYFILDEENEMFKFPREKHGEVIENLSSGDVHCRVYADGFCEHWGSFGNAYTAYNNRQFYFLKEYKDTSYFATCHSAHTGDLYYPSINEKNTKYVGFYGTHNMNALGDWYVCGYLKEGEYKARQRKHLYFFVGNYARTAIEQTAGITSEELNNKIDKQDMVECQVVIKTWHDGTEGYRIWSDGWCEQWGRVNSSTEQDVRISLPKTMRDKNYLCQITLFGDTSGYPNAISGKIFTAWNLTETSFYTYRYNAQNIQQMWKVEGYLAEGEY